MNWPKHRVHPWTRRSRLADGRRRHRPFFAFFLTLRETDGCEGGGWRLSEKRLVECASEYRNKWIRLTNLFAVERKCLLKGVGQRVEWEERYCAPYDKSISTLNPPAVPPPLLSTPVGRIPCTRIRYTRVCSLVPTGFHCFCFLTKPKYEIDLNAKHSNGGT